MDKILIGEKQRVILRAVANGDSLAQAGERLGVTRERARVYTKQTLEMIRKVMKRKERNAIKWSDSVPQIVRKNKEVIMSIVAERTADLESCFLGEAPRRAVRVLNSMGIDSFEALANVHYADLLANKNMGRKSLEFIIKAMKENGFEGSRLVNSYSSRSASYVNKTLRLNCVCPKCKTHIIDTFSV